ncbi:MAG: NADH-quinone oxidoreductase subunit N [Acidobacteria bacterium ADurb.Bin051]|nr:MAG: NADH-quinone oxidoreductase subunit N [Acidobacteria bacterium ADurb.Bin051]
MNGPFPGLAELAPLAPEIALGLLGCLLLVVGVLGRGPSHRLAASLALGAVGVAALCLALVAGRFTGGQVVLAGSFVLDRFALFWKALVLLATAFAVVVSVRFVAEGRYRPGEYYALLLLAGTGMLLMASGHNLLVLWISLELMALSSYVLAGYFREERRSQEAALKYFVLGAVSSGILLYGISLVYGSLGTLRLDEMAAAAAAPGAAASRLLAIGWILLLSGLLFKVAAVPFHVWTPDVYTGAPTPVTAFLAAGSKAISFALLARIFVQGLPALAGEWQLLLAVVSAVTMVWGNLAALTQRNVKRMLAYSSIAHAGYILLGLLAINRVGSWALLFYLLSYLFVTFGVFAVVIVLERREYAGETYEDYAGLARRAPFLAACLLVFLLALTGIPPTGGFVGKLYLFGAAVQAGWGWLAVIGVLMSALSLYYYFRLVVWMYQREATDATPVPLAARSLVGVIAVCAVMTLVLGILPGPFVALTQAAALPVP